jgi:hypothetical protein
MVVVVVVVLREAGSERGMVEMAGPVGGWDGGGE